MKGMGEMLGEIRLVHGEEGAKSALGKVLGSNGQSEDCPFEQYLLWVGSILDAFIDEAVDHCCIFTEHLFIFRVGQFG